MRSKSEVVENWKAQIAARGIVGSGIEVLRRLWRCLAVRCAGRPRPVVREFGWCWIENMHHRDVSNRYASDLKHFRIPQIPYYGYIRFDLKKALALRPEIKRIGLVVFNGVGDYFLCTAFIDLLRRSFPDLRFDAYAPTNKTRNSTPLVAQCLEHNPCFDNVIRFRGKAGVYWKNFDFSECYRLASADTLIIPLAYDFDRFGGSRFLSLCDQFNLPCQRIARPPVAYLEYALSRAGEILYSKIEKRMSRLGCNGVVWLQLNSVSANYRYENAVALVSLLEASGWQVVCVDALEELGSDSNAVVVDVNQVSINDSIKVLSELKKAYDVYCVGVMSCFGAISSALNIPALVLQEVYDDSLGTVIHTNEYIVTDRMYPFVSPQRQFVLSENDLLPSKRSAEGYFEARPEALMACFNQLVDEHLRKQL